MRRASIEAIERMVKDVSATEAEATRDRRLSLTMMNCIWARHTDAETVEPVQGEITGCVPSWLKGTLYRVGPGIIQVGDSCYNHPFDMLSVVQKYTVGPNPEDVTYRNKIIDSKYRDQAQLGGPITVQTDPFRTKLQRFTSMFHNRRRSSLTKNGLGGLLGGSGTPGGSGICDNCIDNICFFGHDMYIMSDIPHMLKIQPESMETLGQVDLEEILPIKVASAHPQIDEDGTVWNIGTNFDAKTGYSYVILKFEKSNPEWSGTMTLENGKVLAEIPSRHKHAPSYFHSFGITRDFVIFIEQPLFVQDENRNGCGGESGSLHNSLKWRKTEMVYFYLMLKSTGEILPVVYSSEPFFFFHVINAFQPDDKYVFLDIVAYKDADIISDLKFSHIERTDHVPTATPIRVKLPLHASMSNCKVVVRKELLVPDTTLEFPRINYKFMGLPNRYFYALGNEYLHPNRILKVDTTCGDITSWKDPGHFVSEPVFVARPNSTNEDDGVLLFTLLSASALCTVQLVILDASDFTEVARISFRANGTVPEGFHGIFVQDSDEHHRY